MQSPISFAKEKQRPPDAMITPTNSKISTGAGLSLLTLVRPHAVPLTIALFAVLGESLTGLLEPWPLKIVFDTVSGFAV
jgi:hypothetical protein